MPKPCPPAEFPPPADAIAARRLREDFAAIGAAERRFARTAAGAALLDCLGGNAPYLAELACREPGFLRETVTTGPETVLAGIFAALQALPPETPRARIGAELRRAKRRAALVIAIADIGGVWPLGRITGALSDLAELCLRVAVRHLLAGLHAGNWGRGS